mgnify:CR=1 FL=1
MSEMMSEMSEKMSEMLEMMSKVKNGDVGNHSCLLAPHTHDSHFDVTVAIVFGWWAV